MEHVHEQFGGPHLCFPVGQGTKRLQEGFDVGRRKIVDGKSERPAEHLSGAILPCGGGQNLSEQEAADYVPLRRIHLREQFIEHGGEYLECLRAAATTEDDLQTLDDCREMFWSEPFEQCSHPVTGYV
jgi:hypothetical protein